MPNQTMPTRTQAIKAVLTAKTHPELSAMYNHDMECQVNVAQDNGEPIVGEFQGTKWRGFQDGDQTWKPFRIPRNAMDEPEYKDTRMTWDLGLHAEGIGMTGWDWKARVSKWVAFDFDAIAGHSEKHTAKLDPEQMREVRDAAIEIPWVTVRYSTSGSGLHLYVFVDDVSTQTHTEHMALARAILTKMSGLAGHDFTSKVDVCGGNMWVWHRKIQGNGLKIIKQGETLKDIPENWRDHVDVVRGKNSKVRPRFLDQKGLDLDDDFNRSSNQRVYVKLDATHKRLIEFLTENSVKNFWWDTDHHMLISHTWDLRTAHTRLGLRGIFETESKGGSDQNCFLFPMRHGAWSVRRYTPGVQEHRSWEQDGSGWTKCYLNRDPTLRTAAMAHQGLEDPQGGFTFPTGADAMQAALAVGATVKIPPGYESRNTTVKLHKDNKRIVIEMPAEQNDDAAKFAGWLRKGNKWIKIFDATINNQLEIDTEDYDDVVRHIVDPNSSDAGCVANVEGHWNDEPLSHIKPALQSMGLAAKEIQAVVGGSIFKPWKLVVEPFKPEYLGDRKWNRRSPQFLHVPSSSDELHYPTWLSILQHLGSNLNDAVEESPWCRLNGLQSGADYLKCWVAALLQYPTEPLPYLFIYGDRQNTGKSMFHESLKLLFNPGYCRADVALTNPNSFNAELEGAVLCIVEETDLNRNALAYNRIKDWVTSPVMPIHRKMQTPYSVVNSTHWVQTANPREFCPVFPGDTRITMIHVAEPPEKVIPKPTFLSKLEKEASDFLAAVLRLEIPESNDRLRIPVLDTAEKMEAQDSTRNALEQFLAENCHFVPGESVTLSDFHKRFTDWLDPTERLNWSTKQSISRKMPNQYPKGRPQGTSTWHWGNLSFTRSDEEPTHTYVKVGDKLVLKENE